MMEKSLYLEIPSLKNNESIHCQRIPFAIQEVRFLSRFVISSVNHFGDHHFLKNKIRNRLGLRLVQPICCF